MVLRRLIFGARDCDFLASSSYLNLLIFGQCLQHDLLASLSDGGAQGVSLAASVCFSLQLLRLILLLLLIVSRKLVYHALSIYLLLIRIVKVK